MRVPQCFYAAALAALLTASSALSVLAQNKFAQPALVAQTSPSALPKLSVPPAEQLVLLIRLSLLTLNDAVLTGNYSVLRDRGGPAFRRANSAASLARIFTTLEAQRPDLAAVATMVPQLSEAQILGAEQLLQIKGHFPTQPLGIDFELMYEPAEGQWQLFGLSVGAARAEASAQPAPAPPASEAPKAAASKPSQPKPPAAKK